MNRKDRVMYEICLWFPGLLIFPGLFAALTAVIFSFAGVDFKLTGWLVALGFLFAMPALALWLRRHLPENDLRLELMYMVNLITAELGIAATVNGQTAAAGTTSVEWPALICVSALILAGTLSGVILRRLYLKKQIHKIIQ